MRSCVACTANNFEDVTENDNPFQPNEANATSEKLAMGYYLDGRAAAVWGTHTHVQTADERVNSQGHRLYHGHRHDRPDRVRARRARGASSIAIVSR